MKFIKKPIQIEAITFAEFVQYAKENSPEPHWSFSYKGHPITHENDECYLIPTMEGVHNFTPKDMLITGIQGEIYPCKIDIFKESYNPDEFGSSPAPSNGLTFGQAIEFIKLGQLVTRAGWNGRGMFIFQRPADTLEVDFIIEKVKSLPQSLKDYYNRDNHSNHPVVFTSYLCMKAADGTIVNGWLASQTDMLADDWQIFTY